MKASLENPIYTVYLVKGNSKYNLTPTVVGLDFSDQKTEMAQSVNINLMNIQVNGQWLSSLLRVRQRVFIYADDGTKNDEVFRGYIWTRTYKSALTDREITLKCYDNLIYWQESEESIYFSPGKSTKDVCSNLCSKWGVKLEYSYSSITHSKLALRGKLADIFTSDLLDLVKDRTGKKYVIRSAKDVVQVRAEGSNSAVYHFRKSEGAVSTRSEQTMDGMVTKVVILGKADDQSDREPVEATINGKTGEYGTIQKLISRDSNTSLADAKKEAQGILKEDGEPKWEYELKAPDIPWLRKGDKVYVHAGDIFDSYLIATSVSRTIDNNGKTMSLTLEKP